jgi:pimeloyl-ACP methyl ester carboxylesterase
MILVGSGIHSSASVESAGDQPASRTFDAKGVTIHYLIEGKGEPVVLLHGLHANALVNWKLPGIIDDLAQDHLVIALDFPGHGRSDKPETTDAYGLQVVENVVLLLDHLKIQKAHIVGYSLGGMVAAKLAATYPDRVLSLTLGGMGWFREGSGLQNISEKLPVRGKGRTPAAFIQRVGELAISEAEHKKIDVPVKVIVGDRDPVKRLYVVPLQQVRTDWPLVEIKGAGHITCILKKELREEIVNWIRKSVR